MHINLNSYFYLTKNKIIDRVICIHNISCGFLIIYNININDVK